MPNYQDYPGGAIPAGMTDPISRLQELESLYRQHPGRRRGGSGTTGIAGTGMPAMDEYRSSLGSLTAGGMTGGSVLGGLQQSQALDEYSGMLQEQDEYDQLLEMLGKQATSGLRRIGVEVY